MPYVLKELKQVFIRRDNYEIITKERAEELEIQKGLQLNRARRELTDSENELLVLEQSKTGDVEAQIRRMDELKKKIEMMKKLEIEYSMPATQKRRARGVLFYSGGKYLNYFFAKHVRRLIVDGGRASQLVINPDHMLSDQLARGALEEAIRELTIRPEMFEQDVDTPQIVNGEEVPLGVREWDGRQFVTPFVQGVFCLRDMKKVSFSLADLGQEINEGKLSKEEVMQVARIIADGRKPGAEYIIQYVFFIDKYFVAAQRRIFE